MVHGNNPPKVMHVLSSNVIRIMKGIRIATEQLPSRMITFWMFRLTGSKEESCVKPQTSSTQPRANQSHLLRTMYVRYTTP